MSKNAAPRFEWRFFGALVPGRPAGRAEERFDETELKKGLKASGAPYVVSEGGRMEALGRVYKVTAPNGRAYVGETVRPMAVRWRAHCNGASYCLNLKRAIEKYGRENMTVEVLEEGVPFAMLRERETHYIEALGTLAPNGYNLRVGGGEKHRFSEETLEKIRISRWKRQVKYFCVCFGTRVPNGCVRCSRHTDDSADEKKKAISIEWNGIACVDCGVKVYKTSTRCEKCSATNRCRKLALESGRPSATQLIQDIEELGFVKAGKKYDIGDNHLRSWLKQYEKHDEEADVLIKEFRERWKSKTWSEKLRKNP